jgi:hypothetical protein
VSWSDQLRYFSTFSIVMDLIEFSFVVQKCYFHAILLFFTWIFYYCHIGVHSEKFLQYIRI